jgi:hypothetical protein
MKHLAVCSSIIVKSAALFNRLQLNMAFSPKKFPAFGKKAMAALDN